MKWIRDNKMLLVIVLALVGINAVFFYISPEDIVDKIGTQNTYIFIFLLASIGGLSTATGAVVYTSMITAAAGGTSPVLVAIAGGTGIFISDSVFYHLALYGKTAIPEKVVARLSRATERLVGFSTEKMLLFTYLYQSFLPLPSDILMVLLVLRGFKYRTVAPVFLAGSITLSFLLAYFGYAIYGA